MPVFKTTITLTVLCEADNEASAHACFCNMPLSDVLTEMEEGSFIGQADIGETVQIPKQEVRDALLAVGNDGAFFEIRGG